MRGRGRGTGLVLGLALSLLLAMALAGCQGEVGDIVGLARRVVPNDWVLQGISPDGRVLRIATFYGGEASDCNRWVGAEVNERDDRVSVRMLLSQRIAPSACTDEGITRMATVTLREPLADRPLVGCGAEPAACRDPMRAGPGGALNAPWRDAVVAQGAVVVSDDQGVAGLDAERGTVLWTHPVPAPYRRWTTLLAHDDVVVVAGDSGEAAALDARSGALLWRAPAAGEGYLPAVALLTPPGGPAAVAVLDQDGTVVARQLRSGEQRWRARPGGAQVMGLTAGGGVVAVLVADEGANGPQAGTVAVFDAVDGTPRWQRTVPERLGALLAVEGTVLAHGEIVRYAWDAATGDQRWRVPPLGPFPRLAATAQGPAAVTDGEVVLFDAVTSSVRRRVAAADALPEAVRVEADRLLLSTRDGHAEVRALDGEVLRRMPLGGAGGRPAAGAALVAVPTHIGVSAFGEDGALRWWWLRELPEERPAGG